MSVKSRRTPEHLVIRILQRFDQGLEPWQLAERFGVAKTTIESMVRKSGRHLRGKGGRKWMW